VGLLGGELYSKSEVLLFGQGCPSKRPNCLALVFVGIAVVLLVLGRSKENKRCKGAVWHVESWGGFLVYYALATLVPCYCGFVDQ